MPTINPITGKRLDSTAQQRYKENRDLNEALIKEPKKRGRPPKERKPEAQNTLVHVPAERQLSPVPEAFQAVCEPPIEGGIEEIEKWMQSLSLRAVDVFMKEDRDGMPRCLTIQECAKAMIKMRALTHRAEQALKVRKLRLGEEDLELVPSEPPLEDPIATVVYVYHQLARFAFQAATDEEWLPTMKLGAIRQMATTAGLNCPAEIKKVIQRAKEGEG